ncbi:MAG: transcription antitermination factor NusB [Coprobacillus sp.]|nr:transcription antitermination factor NusB [Coprobacillus sp.]MCI9093210.1 transcription antitermination factor NusB [Coprobacillus sp.]
MEKTRRQIAREKAIIGVYQNILVNSSFDEILLFLNEDKTLRESEESMSFSHWLIETTLKNKESYEKLLNKFLKKGWTFDRLGVMERAILLIATCELLESDLPKKIIINEAVINAKEFCDDDSYKFINGVLSQVI